MPRTTSALLALLLSASALVGCGILKKKQTDAAPSASQAALQPPPAASPAVVAPASPLEAPVAVADEAVATPEDFEDDAFAKVSDKTYKAELEALKKEIDAK